ncbi:cation-translocating P-type ATPase [Cumulibacter manganitolerans]|uniref:cation-translocating P-type ATPase n=1 Tax=Cumulibacter manganitolerans TaxID=1884992 RepID=UPI001295577B|nr:cation-transporting P-type ATPase [Cumulibacter manganitolerans]
MTRQTHDGLSTAEARRRLADVGPNEVRSRGRLSTTSSVLSQLRDPLILVLLGALLLTLLTGELTEAIVIALVVVVNTTVGVAQEIKADRAITALAALSAPTVRVRRDGAEHAVLSTQLVPGDVVVLGEGDIVPADCAVLDAAALLVDEAALTGESVPVGKAPAGATRDADPRLLAGTVVVKGRCVALVEATGGTSALGRIAALLDTRAQMTPLQQRLARLGRALALGAVVSCLLVLVLGLARGQALEEMLLTAIGLAVAAVPESLPAVVTLSLAQGARRMAARNAVVRHLPAVETLGSVSVLATDKTGTLTEGAMAVEALWTPQRSVRVAADGGFVSADGHRLRDVPPDLRDLLAAGALCNDARLAGTGGPGGVGDPTEVALLVVAARAGLGREDLETRTPRLAERPFDSVAQSMTTAHQRGGDPDVLVVTKGSVEALRARAGDDRDGRWAEAERQAAQLAARGLRVLALTSGTAPADAWADAAQRLLGLVAMADPAKPNARSVIMQCRAAGIAPVLITGDHPATARAIALQVGVLDAAAADDPDAVVTGAQLQADPALDRTAARVFARATPEQKLDIVEAWQRRGAVVAMTGDGVNDGPALHRAHIGVAMGGRGTEVARQAADLVLADDELATVVAAVEEGRRVYHNIRSFLVFGLSGGLAEILVMLAGPFVGLLTPLLATQILWVNLLTHGLTGVAMGAEPAEPDVLRRPPRPLGQSVLAGGLWRRATAMGLLIAALCLGLGIWGQATGRPWQSMLFLALTCLQLGTALGLRPRPFSSLNPWLPLAVAGSLALALAGVYAPALQDLLRTVPLRPADALLAAGLGLLAWPAVRLLGAATKWRGSQ